MKTTILCFLAGLVGIALGYTWAFKAYQPLKIESEVQRLQVDLKLLQKAYVRDISGVFLDRDVYKINLKCSNRGG